MSTALDQQRKISEQESLRETTQAVEGYLVAAIDMLDRHLAPEFYERNEGLLGDLVQAMAIQHQATVAASGESQ